MLFKTYTPATLSSNCEKARAVHTYNAVCRFAKKRTPNALDYAEYYFCKKMPDEEYQNCMEDDELFEESLELLEIEWHQRILPLVSSCGQPLQHQYVVYFVVFSNGGVKCGETGNLIQRYSVINNENEIETAFYLPLNSKEDAKAAEHALQRIFGHSRGMVQQMNKKDYFVCDHDYAVKFVKNNKRKMYNAIMAAVGE